MGTVTDPRGVLVPNIRVTPTHTATGVSRFIVTGSGGICTIALLPAGTYSVTADAKGFKTAVVEGITLGREPAAEGGFQAGLGGSHLHGGSECRPASARHDERAARPCGVHRAGTGSSA